MAFAAGEVNWPRVGFTLLHPLVLCAFIPLIALAAAPRIERMSARVAHAIGVVVFAMVVAGVAEMTWAWLAAERVNPRDVTLNRYLFAGIAGVLLARNWSSRAQQREAERERLAGRLADAQLRVLKLQLHPHFLFNTLNAIAGLLDENRAAAATMTDRLARFLRHSLTSGDAQEVALRDELEFVLTYLDIQRVRFEERLRVVIEVDDEVLENAVPALVLQPIVENSVRHGIAPRKEGGTITLRAARESDMVSIRICDDGTGASPETLSQGIGLTNTAARLKQLYGARQKLTYRSRSGEGFEVELLVPRRAFA